MVAKFPLEMVLIMDL